MKTDSIRDQVKKHYEKQQMSPTTVARLASMLRDEARSRAAERPSLGRRLAEWVNSRRPLLTPAMGTALAIVVILNLSVWYHWHGSSMDNLNTRIALEIAMNHAKNLTPEYQATSIEALGRVMPALDFEPHSPPLLNQLGLALKGARYCTIQGHLALQLKLKDASGRRHTIYQAPYLPPLQKIRRAELNVDDIQITMWEENGIFIGLASQ